MTRKISEGKCSFCGNTFSKAAMTKHLESCQRRKAISEALSGSRKLRKAKILHLVVEGRDLPRYWIHLEAPADTTLEKLDGYLRDIWLECCGHLSAFTIEGKRYALEPLEELKELGYKSMDITLDEVLSPGMKFYHEYDFGTTTELALRVISEREGEIGGRRGRSIQLLARNESPLMTCESCGEIATQVCVTCIWSDEGWVCDECADKHECEEEMFLPVVNSPRVGMCGYTGPEDEDET